MDVKSKRTGKCLCGAVQISVKASKIDMGACHCQTCRKWSGGPFLEVECGSDVVIEGYENIGTYDSSSWAQRGFCKICGTHLFLKSNASGEYGIPPGLFENDSDIQFNRQVFIDHKPSYYSFKNTTIDITSSYIYEHFPETNKNTQ